MNLRYCLMTALITCKEDRGAEEVMRELGITYRRAVPQSLGDQWWFYNCQHIPETLPEFLTCMEERPDIRAGKTAQCKECGRWHQPNLCEGPMTEGDRKRLQKYLDHLKSHNKSHNPNDNKSHGQK